MIVDLHHLEGSHASARQAVGVDVGEMLVSSHSQQVLTVYGLGSCVGLAVYDPLTRVGGMAHIQLPAANRYSSASLCQWAFADRAVPELLRRMTQTGAVVGRLRTVLAGGASVADESGHFQIGRKNYLAVKALLWQHNVILSAERAGGNAWRTMRLYLSNGRVSVDGPDGSWEL
jgi:chemotaxis protein CheD